MEDKYYSFKQIKRKFESYMNIQDSEIIPDEYERFCSEIQVLPKDIIDKILNEIKFVLLSANPKKVNPACYVNLNKLTDEKKEGIIVLTPYIFGAPYIDKEGKERIIYTIENPCILHEVAHHILGHTGYEDQKDKDIKEKDASEKADEWYLNWAEFKNKQQN